MTNRQRVLVYSYRPMPSKQKRFAVASGDDPKDVVSTHGTFAEAFRKAQKRAWKVGVLLEVCP